jgi:hypothetical protein
MFKLNKKFLKKILKSNICYVDGYTPKQICRIISNVSHNSEWVLETDAVKQDRQTDAVHRQIEAMLLRMTGCPNNIIENYIKLFDDMKLYNKKNRIKLRIHHQRSSGEPTTAFGNICTNMQLHAELHNDNTNSHVLTCMLGDDHASWYKTKPRITSLVHTRERNNMQMKYRLSREYAHIVGYIVFKTEHNNWEMCCDIKRVTAKLSAFKSAESTKDEYIRLKIISCAIMTGINELIKMVFLAFNLNEKVEAYSFTNVHNTIIGNSRKYKNEDCLTLYNDLKSLLSSTVWNIKYVDTTYY